MSKTNIPFWFTIDAKADDGGQPTGNAGPRISIGGIGYAKPN